MKKRSLSLILALIMCLGLLVVPVSATGTENPLHFELAGPTEAVYPGDEVTVTVTLAKNPGVAAIDMKPTFDKNVFELVSMQGVGDMSWTCGTNAIFVQETDSTYTGETLKLNLKVKESAAIGNYTIGMTVNYAFNANEAVVEASAASADVKVAPRPVSGITLDQSTLALDQGATATLTATVLPENAGDKTVTWTSDKESVATVNANGVVEAVGAGTATITAKAGDFSATCVVTVTGANVPVTGITLGSAPSAIIAGDEIELTATVTPEYATDKTITWTTSNEAVATVDANGVVTAVGAGSVTITATAGEASATKTFKVFAKLYNVTVDGEDANLTIGKYDSSNTWYRIDVPAGTESIGISGVGDLRFVNHGNKNPKNGDCPTGMTYEDGVLYMDLETYTRNDSYMAMHYGLTYDKYSQRSLEFWGASNWSMTCFFVVIEPCTGEHDWIEANCTEPKHCSVCGTIEGEALGHDWEVTTPEVPAICETPGTSAVEECKREGCDATQGGTTIAAPGHDWHKVTDTKQPTCTEEGETLYTCYTCPEENAAIKYETIEALGHTWDEGEVTTEPTCTEKGVKTFHCTVDNCDGTKTEDIAANGHNYVDGYCTVEDCRKMAPIEIPFTKPDGSAVHSKYDGKVDSLVVDGVRISHWDGFTQKSSLYTEQKITIYVDPADQNESVTLSLKMKDGQAGSGGIIATPATVKLNNGSGSHTASYMYIGTGWSAPQLHLYITFKLGYCTGEHEWTDATCTEPKTCSVCGKTEGEALGHTWGEGSICTVDSCGAANVITEIEVSHPNMKNNAMTMVVGVSEQIDMSAALVDSSVASTQMVQWSSSNETVATVDANGKVEALAAGETVITAKAVDANGIALLAEGDEVIAQFTLTVKDPEEGYTLAMGEDVEAVVNGNLSIPVTIGHTGDVTTYNAFDLTFEYDPAILELTSTQIEGMTVTVDGGKIHVERYGTDLTVGGTALTLTFKAIATGDTNVKVTSAKVDISEKALTQDAPDASVIDNITLVSVVGYTVSLPTEFTGESSVMPGENYTFEAKDKNYNYTFEGSTMGGEEVEVIDNGDGTFTINDVNGNIEIKSEKTAKKFGVTLGDDMTGADKAQYMVDYTAKLTKADGYNYNVTVEIGGVKYTGFSVDAEGNITIPGEAITGAIVFNSNKTAQTVDKHSVAFEGEYGDIADDTLMEIEDGKDYVLTINKVVGYKYTVTATMGGEEVEVKDNGDGTYTIENVTGDLVITIAKEFDLVVEVTEYVTLDDKTMFLVTATATVDDNKVLSYDTVPMFWSNQYQAWSFLVITEGTLSVEDATAEITLNDGTKVELDQTYNVNETANDTVDINDAQLVYDMYNGEYQEFAGEATMQKFLKADVNGDKGIDVNDAVAIVSEIVAAKQ